MRYLLLLQPQVHLTTLVSVGNVKLSRSRGAGRRGEQPAETEGREAQGI